MRHGLLAGVCVVGVLLIGLAAASGAAAAAPANDDFAAAQVLSGPLPIATAGTTVEGTRQFGEPTPPGTTPSQHSIWFRWEATVTGYVSIDTCGSEPRTILAVYTGSALGGLTEVASNGYSHTPNCRSGGSSVTFTAHAGTVYSISVDGDGFEKPAEPSLTGEGAIELEIVDPEPPENDDFADAEPIEVEELSFRFDNWGATKEPGEPDHRGNPGGASVWFEWTAPRTGGASFQACDVPIGSQALVAVYTGSAVGALTPVPRIVDVGGTCGYWWYAVAGTTYRIAYDGAFDPAADSAEMMENGGSLHYFPSNDDFEEADELKNPFTGIGLTQVLVVGPTNVGATKEPGEPDHAGNAGGHSVWLRWTAPETGSVQMSACQANFPPLLAVYMGSRVDALTPVAADDGPPGQDCPMNAAATGAVGFNIHAGVTYMIAVDGHDGAWGSFDFDLWASDQRLKPAPRSPTPITTTAGSPGPPKTKIDRREIKRKARTAVFRLGSDEADAAFRCKLDGRTYARCGKKVTYRHLTPGRHVFRAEAIAPSGLTDQTPAKATFRIAAPAAHHRRR
jgi:hypothetical protein